MIVEYFRPKKIKEAIELLARTSVDTLPLGGGSALNKPSGKPFAVVDLQDLGLSALTERGKMLEIGATVPLQKLLVMERLHAALHQVIRHEAAYNVRQVATVAGSLVASDGRSPFTTALMALDASLFLAPGQESIPNHDIPVDRFNLGDLIIAKEKYLTRRLITQVVIPLNVRLAYDYVARTPADRPIVCVALAQWPSGRTRLVVGGYGKAPRLAMDGIDPTGFEMTARNVYNQAYDEWASADYRQEIAGVLAGRCWQKLQSEGESELSSHVD